MSGRSDTSSNWRRNENAPVHFRVQETKEKRNIRTPEGPRRPARPSQSREEVQGLGWTNKAVQTPCRSWMDRGRCRFGERCRFTHTSANTLTTRQLTPSTPPFARPSSFTPEIWTKYQRQNLLQEYEALVSFDAYMADLRVLLLPLIVPAVLADLVLEYLCLINVNHVEQQIDSLVNEVIDSHDVDEGARCVLDLGTTVLNRVVVHKALRLAVEKYWLKHRPILELLSHLRDAHLLNRTHFEKGLETLLQECEADLVIDNPQIFARIGECLQYLNEPGTLSDLKGCVSRAQLSSRHALQVLQTDE